MTITRKIANGVRKLPNEQSGTTNDTNEGEFRECKLQKARENLEKSKFRYQRSLEKKFCAVRFSEFSTRGVCTYLHGGGTAPRIGGPIP